MATLNNPATGASASGGSAGASSSEAALAKIAGALGISTNASQYSTSTNKAYTTVSNPTQAASIINSVFADLVGRKASQKELDKYTKLLQEEQRQSPEYVQGSDTSQYTTGGVNPQQFLIQEIAKTDDAKANSVMDFYSAFKSAIGVR